MDSMVTIKSVKEECTGNAITAEIYPLQLDNVDRTVVTGFHTIYPREDCDYKPNPNTSCVTEDPSSCHAADVKPDPLVPSINAGEALTVVNPTRVEQPYPVLLIKVKTEPTYDLDGGSGDKDTVTQVQPVGTKDTAVAEVNHEYPTRPEFNDSIHGPSYIGPNATSTYAEVKP
jgi:hypothetical protein